MGINGLSAHKTGGWKAQAARLSRWHRRFEHASGADRLDFFLAFCQNCYCLREWLERDGAASKEVLDRLISGSLPLRICRDISNGSKHLTISRPSVDAEFSIGREYRGRGSADCWFVVAGSEMFDATELARDCVQAWDAFMEQNDLIPSDDTHPSGMTTKETH